MKLFNKVLFTVTGFTLFVVLSIDAAPSETFFPIMPWNDVPNDRTVIDKIKECGFTIAGFVAPEALETCRKVGIKAIVSDARINGLDWATLDADTARQKALPAIVAVRKKPALYGYFLDDEPSAGSFGGLAVMANVLRNAAPQKPAYINLFPNYAGPLINWAQTLMKSIWMNLWPSCIPPNCCYDHYALMDDGTLRDGYWANLAEMRTAAKKYNLPFWNIILAVAHFHYREPTAADPKARSVQQYLGLWRAWNRLLYVLCSQGWKLSWGCGGSIWSCHADLG